MATLAKSPGLLETLAGIIGTANLLTDEAERRFAATDVLGFAELPAAVARPATVAELQAIVQACAQARTPLVVRGGGASYTDGYTHKLPGGIAIDTARLSGIEINAQNATVTVEAGVTWAALRDALKPLGWRTPFWGPFSGLAATVAGSMSQHSISHGSGIWGVSADSAIGFDIITGTGEMLSTGTAHFRHFGPDMAGLFTGDCGALGVKARVRLKLIRRREAFDAASFNFTSFEALHRAMSAIAAEALDDENFGLDATLQQGQIGRQDSVGAKAEIALNVMKSATSLGAGVKTLARMAAAGDRDLKNATFAVHYITEGVSQSEARDRAALIRKLALAAGADEIANTVPTVVRSMPFAPLTNTLGPKGERWVPIHALLAHDQAVPFHHALETCLHANRESIAAHNIVSGRMFMAVGPNAFVYEPTFYWADAQSIYHQRIIPAEHQKSIETFPENPAARAEVVRLKGEIITIMAAHGAAHLQVGRTYPWLASRDAASTALARAMKATLDPHGILNPGALGL